ncbi:hypothetical protein V2W45_1255342, partial [Cenococcum geophilum]
LYVNLEGIRLSRHRSISLITFFIQPRNYIYIVNIYKLQSTTFNTTTANSITLKSILKSLGIIKVFFNIYNNSNALYYYFGV